MFTLPMSQQELADWAGTSADAIGWFLRSWRDRGIIARGERSRRITVIDLDGLAARDVVRAEMYEILRSGFDAARVPWAACYREDRGDGAVIVVPPTISTHRLVDPLLAELADRLRQYNRRASEVVRIQLRVALHVGPVGRDAEGLTGQAVIAAARIVDAPVIKARLAAEQADLIFAASDYVYDHVVRNCAGGWIRPPSSIWSARSRSPACRYGRTWPDASRRRRV
jgi:hypothetical protein